MFSELGKCSALKKGIDRKVSYYLDCSLCYRKDASAAANRPAAFVFGFTLQKASEQVCPPCPEACSNISAAIDDPHSHFPNRARCNDSAGEKELFYLSKFEENTKSLASQRCDKIKTTNLS